MEVVSVLAIVACAMITWWALYERSEKRSVLEEHKQLEKAFSDNNVQLKRLIKENENLKKEISGLKPTQRKPLDQATLKKIVKSDHQRVVDVMKSILLKRRDLMPIPSSSYSTSNQHADATIEAQRPDADTEFIIFDLESTCWPDNTGKIQETTEIGAVRVKNGQMLDEFQTYVKPVINPQLTEFCTTLTKVTQADVDNAPSFNEAYAKFQAWAVKNGPQNYWLVSWGHFDRHKLAEQADNDKSPVGIEWMRRHTSLKHEYARINKLRQPGFGKALQQTGLKFEGTRHTAIDDARNIANLFIKLTAAGSPIKDKFNFISQKYIKKNATTTENKKTA